MGLGARPLARSAAGEMSVLASSVCYDEYVMCTQRKDAAHGNRQSWYA